MTNRSHADAAALIVAVAEKFGLLDAVADALRSINKPPSAAGYDAMIRRATPKQEDDWGDAHDN